MSSVLFSYVGEHYQLLLKATSLAANEVLGITMQEGRLVIIYLLLGLIYSFKGERFNYVRKDNVPWLCNAS